MAAIYFCPRPSRRSESAQSPIRKPLPHPRPTSTSQMGCMEGRKGKPRARALQYHESGQPLAHPPTRLACLRVRMECDGQTSTQMRARSRDGQCLLSGFGVPICNACVAHLSRGDSDRRKVLFLLFFSVQCACKCIPQDSHTKRCLFIPTALRRSTPPSRTRASL
ncbi:MAG: hypothetical protein BYD32DRAFT_403645 [Podila humilis]|nr:MAG: hypothetical protein BYD32DRAFT_403645 [Podila humilis]